MQQLIAQCRRQSPKAQRELYNLLAPKMLGVCMRYAPDRATAQDMLQDGFIKVFAKLRHLRNGQAAESWVYHIMVTTCINYVSRRLRRYEPLEQLADEPHEPAFDADPYAADELMAAIEALPAGQRLAFNLREVEGYTYPEVAALMHCPEGTVRSLLSRAKANLRNSLNPNTNSSL